MLYCFIFVVFWLVEFPTFYLNPTFNSAYINIRVDSHCDSHFNVIFISSFLFLFPAVNCLRSFKKKILLGHGRSTGNYLFWGIIEITWSFYFCGEDGQKFTAVDTSKSNCWKIEIGEETRPTSLDLATRKYFSFVRYRHLYPLNLNSCDKIYD